MFSGNFLKEKNIKLTAAILCIEEKTVGKN